MRFLVLLILLISFPALSQESSPDFIAGVEALKNKDFEKSKEVFTQLLASHPQNPTLMFNLGLAQYNLGQKGLALGLWRKARFLNPSLKQAQSAVRFAEDELFPDQQQAGAFYGVYKILKNISPHIWLALSFLSFLLLAWNIITLVAKRKLPMSQWPYWLFAIIPVFLFALIFGAITAIEQSKVLATVVSNEALTHTSPSETSPTLSSLSEGLLVNVEKKLNGWVQIRTMTGAPGWIEQDKLLIIER